MSLSPESVRAVVFDKAPFGKRGYHEDQVDDFLDQVEATLAGKGTLTADEVSKVIFDPGSLIKRGYAEHEVDKFLDEVVAELRQRATVVPAQAVPRPASSALDERVPHGAAVYLALPPAPPGVRGYRPTDVERLGRTLHHAATTYDGRPTSAELAATRMTLTYLPGQGYHPRPVDALIEAWVVELRMRETQGASGQAQTHG